VDAETLWLVADGKRLREIADMQGLSAVRVNQKALKALRVLCPGIYRHTVETNQTSWPGWCAIIRANSMHVKRACVASPNAKLTDD
jgi:hypothetical protein